MANSVADLFESILYAAAGDKWKICTLDPEDVRNRRYMGTVGERTIEQGVQAGSVPLDGIDPIASAMLVDNYREDPRVPALWSRVGKDFSGLMVSMDLQKLSVRPW